MSEKLVLSISEAAQLLGLTRSQLYQLTRERSRIRQSHPLPVIRLGKRLAFRRASLEQWLAESEQGFAEGGAR
jgi:excisionase family DNA binding protein